jgi:RNA polymerase sigma-70 factor (ECF subfamily)
MPRSTRIDPTNLDDLALLQGDPDLRPAAVCDGLLIDGRDPFAERRRMMRERHDGRPDPVASPPTTQRSRKEFPMASEYDLPLSPEQRRGDTIGVPPHRLKPGPKPPLISPTPTTAAGAYEVISAEEFAAQGDLGHREAMMADTQPRSATTRASRNGAASSHSDEPLSDEALYEENISPIYAFIYSKVGHREAAQDLTADVFVKAFALVDRTQSRATIRSWLYHIARTTVADYWRAMLRSRVIPLDEMRERLREPDATPDDGGLPNPRDVAARARTLLDRLPANYREVLALRFLRGYSVRDTAVALGLSEGNVKVLQHRAIRKARDLGLEKG